MSFARGFAVRRETSGFAPALTPELMEEIREYKTDIIRVMREGEELRRTGINQAERQVFDLACEYFGEQDEAGAA